MKIEEQVVSLELAKQLKDAGYPRNESSFYWILPKQYEQYILAYKDGIRFITINTNFRFDRTFKDNILHGGWHCLDVIAAPTVAELGEKLPFRIREQDNDYWLYIQKLKHGGWDIRYKTSDGLIHGKFHPDGIRQGDTEADARAKMWLYLKEKNLL